MAAKLQSWWQKIRQRRVAIIVITCIIVIAIALIIVGYLFDWSGFNGYTQVSTVHTLSGPAAGTVTRTEAFQPGKSLWDWLQLIIIPLVLAIGGFWFNQVQTSREEKATERRAQVDHEIALDNQRETKLQEYFDKMSELVFTHGLLQSKEGDPARIIARARTLSVVRELDAARKGSLIRFLHESLLILSELLVSDSTITLYDRSELKVPAGIITLNEADLSGAELSGAILMGANLEEANLSKANLSGAVLWKANLSSTNLSNANLSGAYLAIPFLFQNFEKNQSSSVLISINLTGANLSKAHLNQVDLSQANLFDADLSEADLTGATGITVEELEKQVKSLNGAILPDGTIHS